jgi:hypothetical protein
MAYTFFISLDMMSQYIPINARKSPSFQFSSNVVGFEVFTATVMKSIIWRRVVRWMSTDFSEEHVASIFRVEEISSAKTQQASRWQAASTLKTEAICSSETSVDPQRTTRRHIPEDDTLYSSNIVICVYITVFNLFIVHEVFQPKCCMDSILLRPELQRYN